MQWCSAPLSISRCFQRCHFNTSTIVLLMKIILNVNCYSTENLLKSSLMTFEFIFRVSFLLLRPLFRYNKLEIFVDLFAQLISLSLFL